MDSRRLAPDVAGAVSSMLTGDPLRPLWWQVGEGLRKQLIDVKPDRFVVVRNGDHWRASLRTRRCRHHDAPLYIHHPAVSTDCVVGMIWYLDEFLVHSFFSFLYFKTHALK
jgi:hypothetical protein